MTESAEKRRPGRPVRAVPAVRVHLYLDEDLVELLSDRAAGNRRGLSQEANVVLRDIFKEELNAETR